MTGRARMPKDQDSSAKLNQALDNATSAVKDAVGGVQERATQITASTRDAAGNVQEVGDNFGKAVRKSVREQPYATLAVAGAIGFALGAIWRS